MTHLYLIRHGAYDEKAPPPDQAEPLTAEGRRQSQRLRDAWGGAGLPRPDVLLASPARRARETAEILSVGWSLLVAVDPALLDWQCDEAGELRHEEFIARWEAVPAPRKPFFRWVAGGENWVEFSARVHTALDRLVHDHAGGCVALVTHGWVIQAAFEYFFGFGDANRLRSGIVMQPTALTHWMWQEAGGKWLLERHNDCSHLA